MSLENVDDAQLTKALDAIAPEHPEFAAACGCPCPTKPTDPAQPGVSGGLIGGGIGKALAAIRALLNKLHDMDVIDKPDQPAS